MDVANSSLKNKIDDIRSQVGVKDMVIVKNFFMEKNILIEGAILYNKNSLLSLCFYIL